MMLDTDPTTDGGSNGGNAGPFENPQMGGVQGLKGPTKEESEQTAMDVETKDRQTSQQGEESIQARSTGLPLLRLRRPMDIIDTVVYISFSTQAIVGLQSPKTGRALRQGQERDAMNPQ